MIDENEKDFLKFYMEQTWEEMRHIENMRERVTILVVTVASAIVGFIIQQKFAIETKPFVWFIIILGVFGLLMTLKLFQIHQMSQKRLNKWYNYLESFCGNDPQILKLRRQADVENKKDFFYIVKIPHNYFWSAIHLFIVGAGFFLLTMYPKPASTRMEHHCSHSTISTYTNKLSIDTSKISIDTSEIK
jgi:uncharacterized membrane protein YjfL (UPF0719 family)